VIFEITEQDVVFEIDRVVPNIAFFDLVENLWPDAE
jgi:hypothetical protein